MELMDGLLKQVNKQKFASVDCLWEEWELLKYCIEDRICLPLLPYLWKWNAAYAKRYANKVSLWIFHGSDIKWFSQSIL